MDFEEAREFVRNLKLTCKNEWTSYCKGELPDKALKPNDVPATPNITYKDSGWQGWGDWLGTGTVPQKSMKDRPFEEAREFARSLELGSVSDWKKYCKGEHLEKSPKPDDLPESPNSAYKDKGWIGWNDWLGTNTRK